MKTFKQFKLYLTEGGNAVENVTHINQENVAATMADIYKKLLPLLGLTTDDTRLLGSTGKKKPGGHSGDIDMAVFIEALAKKFNTSDPKAIFKGVLSAAGKVSDSVRDLSSIGIVSLAYPIVNADGLQEGDRVQVDLMLSDNLSWSEWIFYSPAEWESNFKGLYRNAALSAISHFAGRSGNDVEWNRKLLHFSSGLHDVSFSKKGKKDNILKNGKEVSRKFIAKDPQGVIDVLLGTTFKASDILTWDDIWKAMSSPKFLWKGHKNDIITLIKKDIEHKGYPLPPEIK